MTEIVENRSAFMILLHKIYVLLLFIYNLDNFHSRPYSHFHSVRHSLKIKLLVRRPKGSESSDWLPGELLLRRS
jgi:hypothetical protein